LGSAAAPLVPTKILPIHAAYGRATGSIGAVPSGPLQEIRAMDLPRGAPGVAAKAAGLTTRTMNPHNRGADGSRRMRRIFVGIAGLALVAVAAGWRCGCLPVFCRVGDRKDMGPLPTLWRVRQRTRRICDRPSRGKPRTLCCHPKPGQAPCGPSDSMEREQVPQVVHKAAATESVRTESRKKRGEGRKHPRLQFLDDGSPLLE